MSKLFVFCGAIVCCAQLVRGVNVTYTISASQSLSVSGELAGSTVTAQTANSLTTTYTGTILADRTASSIQFLNGSIIDAATQGTNQQPASGGLPGSAAADYGMQADLGAFGTGRAALRGMQFDIFSGVINVPGTTFASNLFSVMIDNGVSDFNTNVNFGQVDLSGTSSGNVAALDSMLVTAGSIETLTLRFDASYVYSANTTNDSSLRFTGTIVATRVIPEPSSALMILGFGCAFCRRGRFSGHGLCA